MESLEPMEPNGANGVNGVNGANGDTTDTKWSHAVCPNSVGKQHQKRSQNGAKLREPMESTEPLIGSI